MKNTRRAWFRFIIAGFMAVCLLMPLLFFNAFAEDSPQDDLTEIVTVTTKGEVDIGLMYSGDYIHFCLLPGIGDVLFFLPDPYRI